MFTCRPAAKTARAPLRGYSFCCLPVCDAAPMLVFLRRIAGALMLDAGIFEDVEADTGALWQAVTVVVLSSFAAGLGATGLYDTPATLRFFAVGTVAALAAWSGWALLTYQIGSRILPTSATRVDLGQLLRTLGFAAAPGLLQVFAVLPRMGTAVLAITSVWTLASSVVAVRHALDYSSTARALAVCVLGWVLILAFVVGLGFVLRPTLS
jgi:hypothetical protein